MTLNLIWEFQRILGMPRVAAIAHPFGRPFGEVDDAATQQAVLSSCLSIFDRSLPPGHVEHLHFAWHEDPKETRWHPPEAAPIISYMREQGII